MHVDTPHNNDWSGIVNCKGRQSLPFSLLFLVFWFTSCGLCKRSALLAIFEVVVVVVAVSIFIEIVV